MGFMDVSMVQGFDRAVLILPFYRQRLPLVKDLLRVSRRSTGG
jgi:hypothetical protein